MLWHTDGTAHRACTLQEGTGTLRLDLLQSPTQVALLLLWLPGDDATLVLNTQQGNCCPPAAAVAAPSQLRHGCCCCL
jgi:hypothetical protein